MRSLLAAALLAVAVPLGAQVPLDTIVLPDSAQVVVAPDTPLGRPTPDTVPDSLRYHVLPEVEGGARPGYATGVWLFDREELLAMRGLSLADLLADVPGVTRLRGGDYGAPETVTVFGLAGGEIRVFWDGFEQIPLDGAVPDLARVGLGGVERVRVERHPGELRIEIASLRDADRRPYSLIEAGTGDLDTNFFRGTFVHPRALGGSFGLALDRIDTDGPRGSEDGNRTGGWIRYHRHWSEDFALSAEARRTRASVDVAGYPGDADRTDWVVRARWRPVAGLVLQGYSGKSSLQGLEMADHLPVTRTRSQHGLVADVERGPVRAEAALRFFGGPLVPARTLDLSAVAELPRLGGVSASLSHASWDGAGATFTRVGAWTRSVAGLSLFGGWETGQRGVVLFPPAPRVPPTPEQGEEPELPEPEPEPERALAERSALRLGATLAWRGLDVSAARVTLDTDSLPLLRLPMDREGLVLPGIRRTGLEVAGRIPLPVLPDGFAVRGALTVWDEGARYLPERSYQAAVVFNNRYKESGNLELWGLIGVEGRGPMTVPLADPTLPELPPEQAPVPVSVPFYQSWQALIQVRVLTVRLFVAWENFAVRRSNQDFPDRVLPIFRSHYGVRWTLWN